MAAQDFLHVQFLRARCLPYGIRFKVSSRSCVILKRDMNFDTSSSEIDVRDT